MNRRSFLVNTGVLVAGAILIRPAKAKADLCQGDMNTPVEAVIGRNHGHSLLVPRGDILSGQEKTYNIQGSSGHPHNVTVTADHFAQLRATGRVEAVTTNDAGHGHTVLLECLA